MKRIITLTLALMMVLSLAACGSQEKQPAAEKEEATPAPAAEAPKEEPAEESPAAEEADAEEADDLTFGFAAQSIEYEYFAGEADRLKESLAEQGYDLVISSFDNDAAKQVDVIENFMTMGIDAALVFPMDAVAIKDVCQQAVDSGMTVISGGEDLGSAMTSLYNTDQVATAYGIVEMAKDYIDAAYGEDAAIDVALIDSTATTAMATRRDGFTQAIPELLPNATIATEVEATDTESAMSAAETILQQFPTRLSSAQTRRSRLWPSCRTLTACSKERSVLR